jgi:hypothetical protein
MDGTILIEMWSRNELISVIPVDDDYNEDLY